jgi:hypothetical protein
MRKFTSPLEGLRVAAPCPADWEKMFGDERVRYCNQCSLHVYNLSGMTKREAESLVTNSEGRLCVRYYRRADGSVLTRNCPVGLRAIKQRVSRYAGAALSSVLGFFAGLGLNFGLTPTTPPTTAHTMGTIAMPVKRDFVAPPPPPAVKAPEEGLIQGAMTVTPRPVVGRLRLTVRDNDEDTAVTALKRPKHAR